MPRLGSDGGSSDNSSNNNRSSPTAIAYPSSTPSWTNILLVLAALFLLRNIMSHDYRKEQIESLRATGLSRQEIAKRYVPLSFSESKEEEKKKETDFKQLQNDVESLKAQVQSLQKIIKEDRHENDGATSGENRKENEERKRREPRQDNEEQHRMNLNVSVGASVKKTEQN